MKRSHVIFIWSLLAFYAVTASDVQHTVEKHSEVNVQSQSETTRGRRGVIEEEKYYSGHSSNDNHNNQPWIPGPMPPEDDPTTKISLTNEVKEALPLFQTTERVTDKPTGRGARASNENWIKLPYPGRDDMQNDDVLTPPQPSGDLINSRMPRINFVTQNKALEASESRNDKESLQRSLRPDSIRTDFVRPEDEDRNRNYKPVYPRQALYYPEESRRYFDDRPYPGDELYRRDPYYDMYDRRRYSAFPRIDRYDELYDNVVPRKPKRIIYYAHLPEVARTPPSVDLRYRYSVDPYRRFDEEYYGRTGRFDYRFRNRYPYAPLRKEERNYRDLAGAGSVSKDKKVEEKVTPTPVLPQKDDSYKSSLNINRNNRNMINSHQYHEAVSTNYNEPLTHKGFQDGYLRYEEPLFTGTVEDPYHTKY